MGKAVRQFDCDTGRITRGSQQTTIVMSLCGQPDFCVAVENEEAVNAEFKASLAELFSGITGTTPVKMRAELIKFLYSSQVIPGCVQTSAELAERLFSGYGDPNYRMPCAEMRFIERNQEVFRDMLDPGLSYVSLGCGPHAPVLTKDLPVARMIGASAYVAVDINPRQAEKAAELISENIPKIKTMSMAADFTMPFSLSNIKGPVFMTMFGCTLDQFPPKAINPEKDVVLKKLLKNVGEAVKYSGILVATIDSNKSPDDAVSDYRGSGMKRFMEHLWQRAKHVICDKKFNPSVFSYTPRYVQRENAIVHSYLVEADTSAQIDRKNYIIPAGTRIDVGYSLRLEPEEVYSVAVNSGWEPVRLPFSNDSTIRAVVLVGKDTPSAMKAKVSSLVLA